MYRLARLSLANRAIVALGALIVIGFGLFAVPQLKQQLIPSIDFPAAFVTASYPGASPEIVEERVTTPIEDALQGSSGLETMTSTSGEGVATITLQYAFGTDLDQATSNIQQAVNRIQARLPEGVDPQAQTGSSDDIPAVVFAATSDLGRRELARRLNDVVVPALTGVDGVRDAQVTGSPEQQVAVTLDERELEDKGVTPEAVSAALRANGVSVPAGSLTEDRKSASVQVGETFGSVRDIEDLYLLPGGAAAAPGSTNDGAAGAPAQPPGGTGGIPPGATSGTAPPGAGEAGGGQVAQRAPEPVRLGDVASVALTATTARTLTRTNGKPSLGVVVLAAADGNTVAISERVRDQVPGVVEEVGHDTELTPVFDQAPYVQRSIGNLSTEGALGLGFAVVVILLFLLSLRSTIVTAVSIPLSILVALIALWTGDISLNLLTLGGLTVAVGRVVDDSIVVLENIKRHLSYGEGKQQAVLNGVREVAAAITASTLTTVAVFLPIAFVGGIAGELFQPFAIAVTVALLASLLVALTVIPTLSYWFLRAPRPEEDLESFQRGVVARERRSPLQRVYVPVIRFSSGHRIVTIVLALLILAGTGVGATRLQTNFLDSSGGNTLTVSQTMPVGTNLSTTSKAARKVERVLADQPAVHDYQVTVGGNAYGGPTSRGSASASYQVTLDDDADSTAATQRLRDDLDSLAEVGTVTVSGANGGFGNTQLQVVVQSADEGALRTAAERVRKAVRRLDHVADVTSDVADDVPTVQVTTKREQAAAYGLSDTAIGQAVAASMQGSRVTRMSVNGEQHDVVLRTDDPPASVDDIEALPLTTPAGTVRLDEVATVKRTDGPFSISHVDGTRSATISATPTGSDTGAITAALNRELSALDLPDGVTYSVGGVSEDQSDAFRSLGIALLAAIAIVFLIMTGTFRSIAQPLVLMVSIPFAATGAVGLLLLTDTALGVPALIGVLMLVGIVVTNAIVLMDLMNRYRTAGMSVRDAVVEGGRRRLRPVLMTAVATIGALTPMATGLTGDDGGGFISQSLALVVIGGLISSTLLTLVLVPALYSAVETRKERRRERRQARRGRTAARRGLQYGPARLGGADGRAADGRWVAADVHSVPAVDAAGAPGAARPAWMRDRVRAALAGENPTVLRRLDAGFAVIGDTQFLPGYCVLLTDDPAARRLTDLPRGRRLQFLADAERLAEAVERVCARRDPGFRRVNVEIQGNEDDYLHAHIWPRYDWEPPEVQRRPVGRYPDDRWTDPAVRRGPEHDELRAELVEELDRSPAVDPAFP